MCNIDYSVVGAIFGSPAAGWLVERIGRRMCIIMTSLPYVCGWLLIILAQNDAMLYAGRVLIGFACGMTTMCIPLYIGETASKDIRGILGSFFQIACVLGVLFAYSASLLFPWKWLGIMIAIVPCFMVAIMLLSTTETARYLLMKKKYHLATKSLSWLRKQSEFDSGIRKEIDEMQSLLNNDMKSEKATLSELFTDKTILKPLLICMSLLFFQQLAGVNAVQFYTEPIFESSGYHGDPGIPPVVMATAQLIAVLISTSVIERFGRRVLLLSSGAGLMLSCILLGLYFFILSHNLVSAKISWFAILGLVLYNISYALGWGAIPWNALGELLPARASGSAAGIASAFHWIIAFAVTLTFLPAQQAFSTYSVFWFFASICLCGIITVFMLLPETRGKSLEEIQRHFQPKPPVTE